VIVVEESTVWLICSDIFVLSLKGFPLLDHVMALVLLFYCAICYLLFVCWLFLCVDLFARFVALCVCVGDSITVQ